LGGWKGGTSTSAATVDVSQRRSFPEGFYPLTDIPSEVPLSNEERSHLPQNALGFARLLSWTDYYALRRLSIDSPAALLLTFPLTMYYAIAEYGEVPCTVARLLGRPLRIHLVGVEKELNFLDLFKEVSFLLPTDFSIEMVVVTRNDMLPPGLQSETNRRTIRLLDNLVVKIVCGTYGSDSLDPNFDCGSGPPDMIMAFNAGLFAYTSWRPVVAYLDQHRAVVGVFTDYNEFSGLQCASLGGALCRNSLQMNPFRQPRAMPGTISQ
jgi:zinc finger MYND domain-containing protein 15